MIKSIGIGVSLIAAFFLFVWSAKSNETYLICQGVASEYYGEQKEVFPASQLGLRLDEPSVVGKLLGNEARYRFVLNSIDQESGGSPLRRDKIGLPFTRLPSDMVMSDELDMTGARTLLVLDRINAYAGLAYRADDNGFDFDGFCRNERLNF